MINLKSYQKFYLEEVYTRENTRMQLPDAADLHEMCVKIEGIVKNSSRCHEAIIGQVSEYLKDKIDLGFYRIRRVAKVMDSHNNVLNVLRKKDFTEISCFNQGRFRQISAQEVDGLIRLLIGKGFITKVENKGFYRVIEKFRASGRTGGFHEISKGTMGNFDNYLDDIIATLKLPEQNVQVKLVARPLLETLRDSKETCWMWADSTIIEMLKQKAMVLPDNSLISNRDVENVSLLVGTLKDTLDQMVIVKGDKFNGSRPVSIRQVVMSDKSGYGFFVSWEFKIKEDVRRIPDIQRRILAATSTKLLNTVQDAEQNKRIYSCTLKARLDREKTEAGRKRVYNIIKDEIRRYMEENKVFFSADLHWETITKTLGCRSFSPEELKAIIECSVENQLLILEIIRELYSKEDEVVIKLFPNAELPILTNEINKKEYGRAKTRPKGLQITPVEKYKTYKDALALDKGKPYSTDQYNVRSEMLRMTISNKLYTVELIENPAGVFQEVGIKQHVAYDISRIVLEQRMGINDSRSRLEQELFKSDEIEKNVFLSDRLAIVRTMHEGNSKVVAFSTITQLRQHDVISLKGTMVRKAYESLGIGPVANMLLVREQARYLWSKSFMPWLFGEPLCFVGRTQNPKVVSLIAKFTDRIILSTSPLCTDEDHGFFDDMSQRMYSREPYDATTGIAKNVYPRTIVANMPSSKPGFAEDFKKLGPRDALYLKGWWRPYSIKYFFVLRYVNKFGVKSL